MLLLLQLVRVFLGNKFIVSRFGVYERLVGPDVCLRLLGATVGDRTRICPGLRIQNALNGSCSNLEIGEHVYMGPECLLDLASTIRIEDNVAVSARVSIITHADVGDRPLQKVFPRQEAGVVIGKGAWIGVNTTLLHAVTVGQYTIVGAMSLVNRDIPSRSKAVGIPCRVVGRIDMPFSLENNASDRC